MRPRCRRGGQGAVRGGTGGRNAQQPPDQRPRRGDAGPALPRGRGQQGRDLPRGGDRREDRGRPGVPLRLAGGGEAATVFHEVASDAYFAPAARGFDIVFLDGLHVFAQTFRDFCNTLLVTHERSLILIDDTVPDDIYSSWPHPREARRSGGRRAASAAPGTATSSRWFSRSTTSSRGSPTARSAPRGTRRPWSGASRAGLPAAVQLARDRQPDELVRDAPELRADAGDARG